jgi:hypothetical protein
VILIKRFDQKKGSASLWGFAFIKKEALYLYVLEFPKMSLNVLAQLCDDFRESEEKEKKQVLHLFIYFSLAWSGQSNLNMFLFFNREKQMEQIHQQVIVRVQDLIPDRAMDNREM